MCNSKDSQYLQLALKGSKLECLLISDTPALVQYIRISLNYSSTCEDSAPMLKKLFTFIIYKCLKQAEVFDKPFQPSLMLVGKARSLLQSGAPEGCFTQVSSCITCKNQTRLERLAKDKHCSLLQKCINRGHKKFYSTEQTPGLAKHSL